MKDLPLCCIIGLLCSLVLRANAETDIERILRRAGNEWASDLGSSIESGALAAGFCFSRDDYTDNKDKCIDQPAGQPYKLCHLRLSLVK